MTSFCDNVCSWRIYCLSEHHILAPVSGIKLENYLSACMLHCMAYSLLDMRVGRSYYCFGILMQASSADIYFFAFWVMFHVLLASADFFLFYEIFFSKKFFQEHYQSIKRFIVCKG